MGCTSSAESKIYETHMHKKAVQKFKEGKEEFKQRMIKNITGNKQKGTSGMLSPETVKIGTTDNVSLN